MPSDLKIGGDCESSKSPPARKKTVDDQAAQATQTSWSMKGRSLPSRKQQDQKPNLDRMLSCSFWKDVATQTDTLQRPKKKVTERSEQTEQHVVTESTHLLRHYAGIYKSCHGLTRLTQCQSRSAWQTDLLPTLSMTRY